MKNKIILFVSLLLIVPTVKAAELNVKTVTTESLEGKIKYTGTTDDGVLAVSCSLFKDEEEMDIASNQVNNNTFEGTFDVAGGTYTVKCANYEGGTIVSSEKAAVKNPKTGDSVMKYVLILGISLTGLAGATLVLKKNENSLV